MSARLKYLLLALTFIVLTVVYVSPAMAAAPDGAGPWADNVVSASQGLTKGGLAVPVVRSDQNSALGVAEDDTAEGHFYSLGFGGSIVLGFDNGISSGVFVVEATGPTLLTESAKVEVSENGTTWVNAGQVTQDGTVSKPDSITCAKYVRLTDISNPSEFPDSADGYDVDGVKATGDTCVPPTPTPTPGNCGGTGCCDTNITQINKSVVGVNVVSNANTGNNKTSGNTGNTTITTKKATSTVTVGVGGNTNIANAGCCKDGETNITIKDNGAGSKNTVKIGKEVKAEKVKVVKKSR